MKAPPRAAAPSKAAQAAHARRTHKPSANARAEMDNFVTRSIGSSKERKEEALGVATFDGWSNGSEVARHVAAWRPTKPPGTVLGYVDTSTPILALPAGYDGGRALFSGRLFKLRDAVYARGGAEVPARK